MTEMLVLVDENDNPTGKEEKVKCHLPNGILHRAFTALVFDKQGRLALTCRNDSKMLWPGDWDGTFASHPRGTESYVDAAIRRMPDELGITCELDYMLKFEYHVPYKDVGSENEVCGLVIGTLSEGMELKPIPEEISDTKWASAQELLDMIEKNPTIYCPWMLIALYLLPSSKNTVLEKYSQILHSWISDDIRNKLEKAIDVHMLKDKWRLVE